MTYKFFTNKHDLIDESRDELRNKSLEKILADESRDERMNESRERIRAGESWDEKVNESWEEVQADDLNEKRETFQMSVRREFRADE